MKTSTLLFCIITLSSVSCANPRQNPDQEEWTQLFNGTNLDGWQVKIRGHELGDNWKNTFRVVDGNLRNDYSEYETFDDRFGHIFYQQPFSWYRVAVEYRFVGEQAPGGADWARRNNGVMIHSQAPETMGLEQDFPISIEVQLLGGLGTGERPTANLCTPGTNVVMDGKLITQHCLNSTSPTLDGDQWVRVEALVLGDSLIRHFVNGEPVFEYNKPQMGGGVVSGFDPAVKKDGQLLSEGYIALQSESHPTEFRKVEVLNLAGCMDPKADNYKSYFLKSVPGACRY